MGGEVGDRSTASFHDCDDQLVGCGAVVGKIGSVSAPLLRSMTVVTNRQHFSLMLGEGVRHKLSYLVRPCLGLMWQIVANSWGVWQAQVEG